MNLHYAFPIKLFQNFPSEYFTSVLRYTLQDVHVYLLNTLSSVQPSNNTYIITYCVHYR